MGPKLQSTKNYAQFELSEFNRDVVKTDGLRASMKRHGYIPAYPIHCYRNGTGKLKIKAGHHRFEVAKSLELPVWFVVCDDDSSIPELERGTTHWKFGDYLTSYLRAGVEDYATIVEFSQRTGISPTQAASLLANESASSGNQNSFVKSGSYHVKDTTHAELVGRIILGCRKLNISFATVRNFVGAVSAVARLPQFDMDVFLHRIEVNPGLMVKQATMAQYLDMIEIVYNYHANSKVPLAFLAKEAARERAAVKKPEYRNSKEVGCRDDKKR